MSIGEDNFGCKHKNGHSMAIANLKKKWGIDDKYNPSIKAHTQEAQSQYPLKSILTSLNEISKIVFLD